MTTSVTRPCFTTQHQTCKTKTKTKNTAYKTKTKTDFLVSDRSCPNTNGLRPHHWCPQYACSAFYFYHYQYYFNRYLADLWGHGLIRCNQSMDENWPVKQNPKVVVVVVIFVLTTLLFIDCF